jgi:hypothetical protein
MRWSNNREGRIEYEALEHKADACQQTHVWRANIILAIADGCGTAEIT